MRKLTSGAIAGTVISFAVFTQLGAEPTTAPADPFTRPTLRSLYETSPDQWPPATWDETIPQELRHELGPIPDVVAPESNPFTKEKAELGRKLFWDPRLSGSNNVACVSCHHPDTAWADSKMVSQGHELTPLERNTPTIMGAALLPALMWDGRADSLETQALMPIANVNEMHGAFEEIEKFLNANPGYRSEFKAVFGTDTIALEQVAKALATFQRTIMPGRSRFDAFLRGKFNALSNEQIEGLHLFRTKARCLNCHNGPVMSDGLLHNEGLTYYGRQFEDLGQYLITRNPEDVGKFRTPTLRNVSRTAPYMHNGLFELEGVINIYNAGMPNEKVTDPNDPLAPKKSHLLKRLELTPTERAALKSFLEALEEPKLRMRAPSLPGLRESTTRPTTDAVAE